MLRQGLSGTPEREASRASKRFLRLWSRKRCCSLVAAIMKACAVEALLHSNFWVFMFDAQIVHFMVDKAA